MHILFVLVFTIPIHLIAQYTFAPSNDHPYGLPNPDAPSAMADFAPMIGSNTCASETRNPDGTWSQPEEMLWQFKYMMNGMAIQDESLKPDGTSSGSIRQYSQDSSEWIVHWYSNGSVPTTLPSWKGSKEGDSIMLYRPQQAPNGADGFFRLTFYNIQEESFDWVGEWVNPEETIVYPTWKISCTKDG